MKKIFLFTFLIIFLFNFAGYFIVFKVEQYQIKSEIEAKITAGIETEALTIITIEKSDFQSVEWVEGNKEFRYKGGLYDVVKNTETRKTITYYCISDLKEESLFSDLDEHIHVNVANNSQKSSKKLNNHVIKLYFLNTRPILIPQELAYFPLFSSRVISASAILEINTPPPQFA